MQYKTFDNFVKFLCSEIPHLRTLEEIKDFFTKQQVTTEHFDGLCICFFTQNIRLSDGYVCGCCLAPLCRVAEATGLKPSEKIASYIQARLFKCGGDELERIQDVLGIGEAKGG